MTVQITSPVKGYTGKVAGVTFSDGVGETDDQNAINYFTRHGYTVEADTPTVPEGEPTDKWTIAQLTAYADTKDISLDGVKGKPAILAALGVNVEPSKPSDPSGPTAPATTAGQE